MPVVLRTREVRKTYAGGDSPVEAVRGVDLALHAAEFVAIMGPSGCGKSTLLHLCGAMDRPSSGQVEIEGRELSSLDDRQLTRLRRNRIGFVFQFFNLLPTLTVAENIALPLLLAGVDAAQASRRALDVAGQVGIDQRSRHYPQELSGGEMQRAAIARAIVHKPALVVADEPTGNLDSANGSRVVELLRHLNRASGIAILLATHSTQVAAASDRVLHMMDGRIQCTDHPSDSSRERVTPIALV